MCANINLEALFIMPLSSAKHPIIGCISKKMEITYKFYNLTDKASLYLERYKVTDSTCAARPLTTPWDATGPTFAIEYCPLYVTKNKKSKSRQAVSL